MVTRNGQRTPVGDERFFVVGVRPARAIWVKRIVALGGAGGMRTGGECEGFASSARAGLEGLRPVHRDAVTEKVRGTVEGAGSVGDMLVRGEVAVGSATVVLL